MSVNLTKFVKDQSKLVTKAKATRVSKLDLTGKKIRGEVKLHIVPDSNDLPMLTTKGVMEVHQTETYTYQDEVRTRYPVYTIPSSVNYNTVPDAVMPTDMQLKKLDRLYELLSRYRDLTNLYQEGGPKLDKDNTDTKMWIKYIGTYTKFWAKIDDLKPSTPDPKAKAPDFSKLVMVTHSSANFVKEFNNWATPDKDADISMEDQEAKCLAAVTNEVGDNQRCIKIVTEKGGVGYDVEVKHVKVENASVSITEEDVAEATPLIQEDWDYTVFDDEKVDTLLSRVEKYLENVDESVYVAQEESEDDGNPFADDEE
jgi:hypothetical protein